jgi:hypothetical protein
MDPRSWDASELRQLSKRREGLIFEGLENCVVNRSWVSHREVNKNRGEESLPWIQSHRRGGDRIHTKHTSKFVVSEDTPSYHLSSNRSAHNFIVQFGGQIPKEALLKWLVIQFVDMKRPQDVVMDLLQENRIEVHLARPFLARIPQCGNCVFSVHLVVKTIMNTR